MNWTQFKAQGHALPMLARSWRNDILSPIVRRATSHEVFEAGVFLRAHPRVWLTTRCFRALDRSREDG